MNFNLFKAELKAHPFILGIVEVNVFSLIATWYAYAQTLGYPELLTKSIGAGSLLSGAIAWPTMLGPRLVTISSGIPSEAQQFIEYMMNLLPEFEMTVADKQNFAGLKPEFQRGVLHMFSARTERPKIAVVADEVSVHSANDAASVKGQRAFQV